MQTQTMPKIKTTLNFNTDFYYGVKKRALEKRQTISEYFYELAKDDVKIPVMKSEQKSKINKLFPGIDMGPIKGNLSREELYDFI